MDLGSGAHLISQSVCFSDFPEVTPLPQIGLKPGASWAHLHAEIVFAVVQ